MCPAKLCLRIIYFTVVLSSSRKVAYLFLRYQFNFTGPEICLLPKFFTFSGSYIFARGGDVSLTSFKVFNIALPGFNGRLL